MRESLSFKNIFKREMKLASYIVICVTIVVISLSYAMFFQVNENSSNQEVIAGDLTFTYTNGGEITDASNSMCFSPMTNEEASLHTSECSYKFSVRNTGSLKASYTIKVLAKDANTVELNKVKIILKKQKGESLENVFSAPKLLSELTDGILVTEEMESHQNIVYSIQLYIEEELFEDGDEAKKVSFQIEGSGLVHEENPLGQDNSLATSYIQNLANTSEELVDDETPDNNLRYVGKNPNNYVSFNNELWRIIGVMNNIDDGTGKNEVRLKIVRNESIGDYSWDTSDSSVNSGLGVNEWSDADAMKLLNPGYESEVVGGSLYWNQTSGECYTDPNNTTTACDFTTTGLTSDAKSLIAETVWHTGSNGNEILWNEINTNQFYALERSNNTGRICTSGEYCNDTVDRKTTWTGYIGLISPSDYGYAIGGGSQNRTTCMDSTIYEWGNPMFSSCYSNNWIYDSSHNQWTLFPHGVKTFAYTALYILSFGSMGFEKVSTSYAIFPTVFLNASVKIVGGVGTQESPFEISL